jgi:hypothetical protein
MREATQRALARSAGRLAGQPGAPEEERQLLLAFARQTWPGGWSTGDRQRSLPLAGARWRMRQTARYHRWKLVGL